MRSHTWKHKSLSCDCLQRACYVVCRGMVTTAWSCNTIATIYCHTISKYIHVYHCELRSRRSISPALPVNTKIRWQLWTLSKLGQLFKASCGTVVRPRCIQHGRRSPRSMWTNNEWNNLMRWALCSNCLQVTRRLILLRPSYHPILLVAHPHRTNSHFHKANLRLRCNPVTTQRAAWQVGLNPMRMKSLGEHNLQVATLHKARYNIHILPHGPSFQKRREGGGQWVASHLLSHCQRKGSHLIDQILSMVITTINIPCMIHHRTHHLSNHP